MENFRATWPLSVGWGIAALLVCGILWFALRAAHKRLAGRIRDRSEMIVLRAALHWHMRGVLALIAVWTGFLVHFLASLWVLGGPVTALGVIPHIVAFAFLAAPGLPAVKAQEDALRYLQTDPDDEQLQQTYRRWLEQCDKNIWRLDPPPWGENDEAPPSRAD